MLQFGSREVVNKPVITGECLSIITSPGNISLTALAKVSFIMELFISITATHDMCNWTVELSASDSVYGGLIYTQSYTHINAHTHK